MLQSVENSVMSVTTDQAVPLVAMQGVIRWQPGT